MPKLKETKQPVSTGFANVDRMLNSGLINRSTLAKLMYPSNQYAKGYLYNKLNNLQRQSFGTADRDKLLTIIKDQLL